MLNNKKINTEKDNNDYIFKKIKKIEIKPYLEGFTKKDLTYYFLDRNLYDASEDQFRSNFAHWV